MLQKKLLTQKSSNLRSDYSDKVIVEHNEIELELETDSHNIISLNGDGIMPKPHKGSIQTSMKTVLEQVKHNIA